MQTLLNPSKWASAHVKTARTLIVLISILAGILFFEIGLWLPEMSKPFSFLLWSSALALMFYAWKTYKKGSGRVGKRFMINFALMLLWLHLGNQSTVILPNTETVQLTLNEASVGPVKPIAKADKKVRGQFRKHLLKRKDQLKKGLGSFNEISPVGAFFLFLLLGLLAIAIAYFLAILSCSLSCSGQVVASYAVLVTAAIFALGGLFLIGYGIYRLVRKPQSKSPDFIP